MDWRVDFNGMISTFHFADVEIRLVALEVDVFTAVPFRHAYTQVVRCARLACIPFAIRGSVSIHPVAAGVRVRRRFRLLQSHPVMVRTARNIAAQKNVRLQAPHSR